jgi:glycosyltransferase involved in cell wall biosynthesis
VDLSVAICTYNPSAETLLRALDAIVAQLPEVPSAELIVIDNNSSPALTKRDYLASYPIRLIREPTPGLTAAREAVIRNARGDVIVFVDDDNVLGARYLATVVRAFSGDSELGLLGGCIVPEYESPPPSWFEEFEPWIAVRRYTPDLHVETTAPPFSGFFPVGAGLCVRRDLALAYSEDCAGGARVEGRRGNELSSGEDVDLGFFALSQGRKLVVTGSLNLTHVIQAERITVDYLARLAVSNVRSSLQLEQKWAPRFGRSVLPMVSVPIVDLLARTAATTALSPWSPRFRIKRRRYMALTSARRHGGGRSQYFDAAE